jgi:hypothetical protein
VIAKMAENALVVTNAHAAMTVIVEMIATVMIRRINNEII